MAETGFIVWQWTEAINTELPMAMVHYGYLATGSCYATYLKIMFMLSVRTAKTLG